MKTIGICVVDGCGSKKYACDLCAKHWVRLRKHGDVNYVTPRHEYQSHKNSMFNNPERHYYVDVNSGCWTWLGYKDNLGYGRMPVPGGRSKLCHKVIYEKHNGPVPAGLELDHLCKNPSCVNPAHLEAVTHAENVRRGLGNGMKYRTHCKYGHEYTPENTKNRPSGGRACRLCLKISSRNRYREKRGIPINAPRQKTGRKPCKQN